MADAASAPAAAAPPRASPFSAHAFIVGSARSGTTWTQLLLAQHPRVATTPETHVFSRYLGALVETYDADAARGTGRGLTRYLSREDVLRFGADFLDRLAARVAQASGPGADLLLQKVPDVGGEAGLILDLHPKARFVHVVRDPRAVVASITAASKGWGKDWAPRGAARATRLWREAVAAARRIPERTDAYLEVRYEALHADTPGTLGRVLEFLGLEGDRAFCEAAATACRFEDLRDHASRAKAPFDLNAQRDGFFRKGLPDAWREDLSARDVRLVEATAWDLMRELGYEPVSASRPRLPFLAWLHRKRRHLAHQVERATARWARRLDASAP